MCSGMDVNSEGVLFNRRDNQVFSARIVPGLSSMKLGKTMDKPINIQFLAQRDLENQGQINQGTSLGGGISPALLPEGLR